MVCAGALRGAETPPASEYANVSHALYSLVMPESLDCDLLGKTLHTHNNE